MKIKKIFLLLLLVLLVSCSNNKLDIVEENIGDSLNPNYSTYFLYQNLEVNCNLIDANDSHYIRFSVKTPYANELKTSQNVFFVYVQDLNELTVEANHELYDDYSLEYYDIEINKDKTFIYNVSFSIDEPSNLYVVYDSIFVNNNKDNISLTISENLNYSFAKNFKWNINKVKFEDKIYYMFYVENVSNNKFNRNFKFLLEDNNGIEYKNVEYINDKKFYILLEDGSYIYQVELIYDYTKVTVFNFLDLR